MTVRDAPIDVLVGALEHLAQCRNSTPCQEPIHTWSLEAWQVVWERLTSSWISSALYDPRFFARDTDPKQLRQLLEKMDRELQHRAHVLQVVWRSLDWLFRRAETNTRRSIERTDKLEAELAQLQNGHLLRSHNEIYEAVEIAMRQTAQVGVAARRQYAAARVAEALKWVLEPPATPTKTLFQPQEPA